MTSYASPPPIPTTQYKTASSYDNYYADVPDDVSDVTIRASAWSIVPVFWDGLPLDATYLLPRAPPRVMPSPTAPTR